MIVDTCQRWRDGSSRYVVIGPRISPADYSVRHIHEREARPFVADHHYSRSFPAARACFGLFRAASGIPARLVGVAVISEPMQARAVPAHTGMVDGAELGRLVLLDDVPGDGESWFCARAFRAMRDVKPTIETLLSYSDPVERRAADGTLTKPGHVGIIYQALSAHYRGVTGDRTEYLAGGVVVSRRTLSKISLGERGIRYAVDQLVSLGAPPPTNLPSPAIWLRGLEDSGFVSKRRRPGNHAYVLPLTRRARRASATLPCLAYPRKDLEHAPQP